MLYLLLATICSATIALVFKYSESRDLHRMAVTSTNYLTASVVSLVSLLVSGLRLVTDGAVTAFANELPTVVLGNVGLFTSQGSLTWAVLLGLVTGVLYLLGFLYYQLSVRQSGAGLSGAFGKMGILLPMLLSLVLWKELPGALQWVGITLALGSIAMVSIPWGKTRSSSFQPALLLLFLCSGTGEFANKLFQKYAIVDFKSLFLLVVFFTAFCISVIMTVRSGRKPGRADILTGIAVGIPNMFSSFFLISALNSMPTSVAYPVYSAGSIVLINLGGAFLFKERLKPRELGAVGLTMLALVLINL